MMSPFNFIFIFKYIQEGIQKNLAKILNPLLGFVSNLIMFSTRWDDVTPMMCDFIT